MGDWTDVLICKKCDSIRYWPKDYTRTSIRYGRCIYCLEKWFKERRKGWLTPKQVHINTKKKFASLSEFTCRRCKVKKSKDEFNISSFQWSLCKECYNEYRRNYNKTQAKKFNGYANHIKSRYGLTIKDYNELLKNQDGKCAICREFPSHGKYLHVDHDHKTNKIRGLLCHRCNAMIGWARENRIVLIKAADYLLKYLSE